MFKLLTSLLLIAGSIGWAAVFAAESIETRSSSNDNTAFVLLTAKIADARAGDNQTALFKLLLQRADRYRTEGYFRDAGNDLREALALSGQQNNEVMASLANGALGQLYSMTSAAPYYKWTDPEPLLKRSLSLANRQRNTQLIAIAQSRLGDWYYRSQRYTDATASYQQSLRYAPSDNAHRADVLVDIARVAIATTRIDQALDYLAQAYDVAQTLSLAEHKATAYLEIRALADSIDSVTAKQLRDSIIKSAVDLIPELTNTTTIAVINGHQGSAYERRGSYLKAQQLTERAISLAPDAHDLVLQWEWQLARLYELEGDRPRAIDAYRRAVFHADKIGYRISDKIRHDIPSGSHSEHATDLQTLSPVYMGLANLLLHAAEVASDSDTEQALLVEAQSVVERMKGTELQDYYRDSCLITQTEDIGDKLGADTAVLYPILLPDRLVVLVRLDGQFHQRSVAVTSVDLNETVRQLADELRYGDNRLHQRPARRLYRWLINPVESLLDEADIQTLVFVPDGSLRQIPLTTLWDGEQYLVERYAVVNVPGLTLLNAQPFSRWTKSTLLAGLSEPGAKLLDSLGDALGSAELSSRILAQRQRSVTRQSPALPFTENTSARARMQSLFSLPAVKEEIDILSSQLPSSVLINESFLLDRFKQEVIEQPYRIVHIASHGYFGRTARESWIMAHDRLLRLGELNEIFRPREFSSEPVELLVLSACQTAEGNDRAPLGLSGAALASGARSVLGSLWAVDDRATLTLMSEFYRSLNQGGNNKAQALRNAQLSLLSDAQYRHPYYWSAFILVGNWI